MNSTVVRRKTFGIAIKRKLGDSIPLPEKEDKPSDLLYLGYVGDGSEILNIDDDMYNTLINEEVI